MFLCILLYILYSNHRNEKYTALKNLMEILNNKNDIIMRSDTNQMFPTIYSNVCLFLCRLKRYREAIILSSSGIDYSIKYNNISSLAHLHYVKSHSQLNLMQRQESEIEAAQCIACAIAKGNVEEMNVFFNEIEVDHMTNPIILLDRHQQSIRNPQKKCEDTPAK